MKNIVFAIALFISSVSLVKAQTDPCSEIEKKHDDELGKTQFHTPYLFNIFISRSVKDGGGYDNITMHFTTHRKTANYNASGLFVTFDDGTIWKDLSETVDCTYENINVGYSYDALAYFNKTTTPLSLFKTKKIVKVRLDNIEITVDDALATKLKAWANCIETIN